jgi:hypothetical protein
VADLVAVSQRVPLVGMERRMKLGPVAAARAAASPRPGWCAVFTKAFAVVSARIPELRRAYLTFPWPRFFESAETIASVAVERDMAGDVGVGFAVLRGLDTWPVTRVHEAIRRSKSRPEADVATHRRAIRLARLPRPLRRFVWWAALNISGGERARQFGTFGVTAMAGTGSTSHYLLSPLTTTLTYGVFDAAGDVEVRITFDHRVYDGGVGAKVLATLEDVLLTEVRDELRAHRPAAAVKPSATAAPRPCGRRPPPLPTGAGSGPW